MHLTYNLLTPEQQTDVILSEYDLEPWEIEHGRYQIDDDGFFMVESYWLH